MQRFATEEAWKSLSEDFAWTAALLEKNCDKVDWTEIWRGYEGSICKRYLTTYYQTYYSGSATLEYR